MGSPTSHETQEWQSRRAAAERRDFMEETVHERLFVRTCRASVHRDDQIRCGQSCRQRGPGCNTKRLKASYVREGEKRPGGGGSTRVTRSIETSERCCRTLDDDRSGWPSHAERVCWRWMVRSAFFHEDSAPLLQRARGMDEGVPDGWSAASAR